MAKNKKADVCITSVVISLDENHFEEQDITVMGHYRGNYGELPIYGSAANWSDEVLDKAAELMQTMKIEAQKKAS